jgi:putative nucleotidyltransferase with HDIG domain
MTSWNGAIAALKKWYEDYARSYRTGDAELEDAVALKCEHTFRVCSEMELLCDSISLDERQRLLALIAALFHDIARFEQFQRHRTFADDRSFNHGKRGAEILAESRVLFGLESSEVDRVLCAIRYHNAPVLPPSLPEDEMLLCRLTRDADKLDIFRIAIQHYSNPDPRRGETVMIGISAEETISPEICRSVLGRKAVSYSAVKTMSDFKMLQIGWIFDLNFQHSLRCVRERGYVDAIGKLLPADPEVQRALQEVNRHIDDALA